MKITLICRHLSERLLMRSRLRRHYVITLRHISLQFNAHALRRY